MNDTKYLDTLYEELLKEYIDKFGTNNKMSCMYHVKGEEYKKNNKRAKILFVGRAPNGWYENIYADKTINDILDEAKNCDFDLGKIYTNPIGEGINDKGEKVKWYYNKSAFWQLAKRVVSLVSPNVGNWSSEIAWTNLFKIAPANGGNPSYDVMLQLIDKSLDILEEEIRLLEPSYVVMVTDVKMDGIDLSKMLEKFNIKRIEDSFIVGYGGKNNVKIVVVKRPEYKTGTRKEQAEKIVKLFNG